MVDQKILEDVIPEPPEITEEQLENARKTGNYELIAFEEYKFVAQLVAFVSRIEKTSRGFKEIPDQHYNILMGLMNRSARLMLGTLQLSHKGKFGETSSIIFRCIFETGVKISWLCMEASQDKFDRYINSGLKTEVELKERVVKDVEEGGGSVSKIQKQILDSIDYHIKKGETSEGAIKKSKKMPNLNNLIEQIGFNRLMYVSNYSLGSHHVHGNWPSLVFHYLEEVDGKFVPRGNNVGTKANQYIVTSLIILKAIAEYVDYVLDPSISEVLKKLCEAEEQDQFSIFEDMTEHGW